MSKTAKPRFSKSADRIITDRDTRLEWHVGPDLDITWKEAKKWAAKLSVWGGGWRLPTRQELRQLYQPGLGTRNLDPCFDLTGWWIWSGEIEDASSAYFFHFEAGEAYWDDRGRSCGKQAFAVCSRQAPGTRAPEETELS
jgi:hypothetical protein